MIRESEACGIMSHGRDDHKQMQRGGSAAMAEETAAREAAAVAAGLLAYCTVLERPSLIGERATSEIMAANHGSSGDGNSGGCGSGGSAGWIMAAGWAATVAGGYGGSCSRVAAGSSMRRRFCLDSRILGMFCDRIFVTA